MTPFFNLITSKHKTTVTLNAEMVNQLCNALENALDQNVQLHPAVYALGQQLAHWHSPGCYFGVNRRHAA